MKKNSKKFKIRRKLPNIITVFVMILGLIIIYFVFQGQKAKAEWFNDSWMYRQQVDITNSGSAQTDFQVQIILDTAALITAGKMQSDCDDIRITDINGKVLPHWIEENNPGCNDSVTKIWTKVPSIPTSDATVYLYYGHPSASNIENGANVFQFFEDFSSGNLDNWTNPCSATVTSGYMNIPTSTSCDTTPIYVNNLNLSDSSGYILEFRGKFSSGGNGRLQTYQRRRNSNGYIARFWITGTAATYYQEYSGSWGANTNVGANNMSADTWYNLKVQVNGSNNTFFVNGSSIGSNASSASLSPYTDFTIGLGQYQTTVNYDNVRIRKYASTEPSAGSPTNEEQSPGPVAYWKFDEGADNTCLDGKDICDSTTNNLNGTLYTAAVSWATEDQCISGKCVYIEDVGSVFQSIQVLDNPALGGMPKLSVSLWLKMTESKTTHQVLYKRQTGGSPAWWSYKIEMVNSKAVFYVVNSSGTSVSATSDNALDLNRWYHLEGVYNGSQVQIYVNGVAADSTPASLTGDVLDSDSTLYIGGLDTPATYFFHGYLDEVKIYPYARSAAQIKADYLSGSAGTGGFGASVSFGAKPQKWLSDGLVGYWKMDESSWNGTPGEVIDSSGNNNNGTSTDNANTTSTSKFGNAGDFDGSNDNVNLGTQTILGATTRLTISVWIKPNVAATNRYIYMAGDDWDTHLNINNNDTIRFSLRNSLGTRTYFDSVTAINEDSWNFIIATWDGSTMKMSINGNEDSNSGSFSGTVDESSAAKYIGIDKSGVSNSFDGVIDEVRIYNRTLSSREIRDLYNWAPGPVAEWKFDEKTGSSVYDISGNGNTGTLNNMDVDDWVIGKYGSALEFDETNEYISLSGVSIGSAWTIGAWAEFPLASTGSWNTLVRYGSSVHHILVQQSTGEIGSYNSGFKSSGYDTDNLSAGWHYITAIGSGTTTNFYIDSSFVGTANDIITSDVTEIGNATAGSQQWGKADHIIIYNYARTPKQIVEDMNAGHPAVGSPVGSQVGYWKFDEGYGSTVQDQSLNDNDLIITNATSSNQGKFGKALNFDGSSAYLSKTSSAGDSLNPLVSITITAWIKPDAAQQGMIVSRNGPYGFKVNADRTIYLNILAGSTLTWNSITTIDTVPQNQWSYVVGVYDGTDIKIYINGVLSKSGAHSQGGNMQQATKTFWIGYGNPGFDKYFDGLIDEVKIYSFALTEDEIKLDYNRGAAVLLGAVSTDSSGNPDWSSEREYCIPGDTTSCSAPVAEWKFDEKTGTTTNDTSVNNYIGTFQNSPSWTTGKYGSAIDFDNSDWLSTSLDIYDLYTGGAFTVEAWSYDTAVSSYDTIASSFKSSPYDGFYLRRNTNGTAMDCCIYNNGTSNCASTSAEQNVWIHWSCTYSSSVLKLYKNGDYKAQDASASMTDPANTFKIGANYGSSENWEGKIDNVKVYDYARTQAQIAWDYNRGGPVGWWKFDECQATTTYDSSGNGNNGAITIGGTGSQDGVGTCSDVDSTKAWYNGVDGKYNSSLNFDGIDDEVLNSSGGFLPTGDNPKTVTFWFKPNAGMSDADSAVGYGCPAGEGYNCSSEGVGRYVGAWANTSSIGAHLETCQASGPSTPSPTTDWHFYTAVFNGDNTITFYVDARSPTLVTPGCTINTSSGNGISIGVGRWGYYDGQIDDVKIYNYALVEEQIKNVMNQDAAIRFGPN